MENTVEQPSKTSFIMPSLRHIGWRNRYSHQDNSNMTTMEMNPTTGTGTGTVDDEEQNNGEMDLNEIKVTTVVRDDTGTSTQQQSTVKDEQPSSNPNRTPSSTTTTGIYEDESMIGSCSSYFSTLCLLVNMKNREMKEQFQLYHEHYHLQYVSILISCMFLIFLGIPFAILARIDFEHPHTMIDHHKSTIASRHNFGITCGVVVTSILILFFGGVSHCYDIKQQWFEKTNEDENNTQRDRLSENVNNNSQQEGGASSSPIDKSTIEQSVNHHTSHHNNFLMLECLKCKRFWRYLQMFAIHVCVVLFFIRRSDPFLCSTLINGDHVVNSDGSSSYQHSSYLGGKELHGYFCGSEGNSHTYSEGGVNGESAGLLSLNDALLLLIVHPIVLCILFPSVNLYVIWCQTISSLIVYLTLLCESNQSPPAFILIIWILINISLPLSHYRKNIRMFLMHRRLQETSQQDTKDLEEQHLTEMRFVIANVAHDLKTPLTSFTSGIEFIKGIVTDLEQGLSEGVVHIQDLTHQSQAMKQSLQTIVDTNSFMLMTINRCIDYAKASKGIKLMPRLETIDLWETMQLPLTCMRNVQDRVKITMFSMPQDVCSHVITDKQWLQENLLCLLSNAVKYTSHGKVTLTLSLCDSRNPITMNNGQQVHGSTSSKARFGSPFQSTPLDDKFKEEDELSTGSHQTQDSLYSTKPTQFLLFEVEDNGIGVPPELMDSLFRPFKQTQRLAGGTGLGLYSLAKRIEAIHGEYGVKGRKDGGKGSLFWFTIPYRPDEVTASAMNSSAIYGARVDSTMMMPNRSSEDILGLQHSSAVGIKGDDPSTSFLGIKNADEKPNSNSSFVDDSSPRKPPMSKRLHNGASTVQEKQIQQFRDIFSKLTFDEVGASIPDDDRGLTDTPRENEVVSMPRETKVVSVSDKTLSGSSSIHGSHKMRSQSNHTLSVKSNNSSFLSDASFLEDGSNNSKRWNILLVDDSLSIVKMTSMMLKKRGHTVVTAENGEVAIKTIEEYYQEKGIVFDIVLMDLQMPVLDGLEATKRIRMMESMTIDKNNNCNNDDVADGNSNRKEEKGRFPKQTIIGVSANSDYDTVKAALAAGINGFLAKPFTIDAFTKAVNTILEKNS